jgi:hypothetical protein
VITNSPNAGLDRRDYLALSGVIALVLLVYAQLWLPGLVLIKRDAFQLFLPLKQYIINRLSAGELPQWFPYEGLGRPLIALTAMGVFHPFTAVYWLFPVHDAYRLCALLSYLLGASGAFMLARVLGVSRLGAALGSIGFSCSGYLMSMTENLLYLYSLCALPFFLFSLEKLLTTQRLAWIGASTLIWASVILHGDIQTAYYYGFVALIWVAMRATGARRDGLVRLIAVGGLTVLVAAIQLAPAWVGYQHSDRVDRAAFHAEAIHWSTHPVRLLTLAVSPIGDSEEGDRIAQALFHIQELGRGPSGLWAESLYIGPVLLGLGVAGCWRRRDMLVFGVIAGIGLTLAMGSYAGLYDLFYQWMPFWSAFRYPEKFMGIATFALSMLAAAGVDVLDRHRRAGIGWVLAAGLFAAFAGLLTADRGTRALIDIVHVPSDLARHISHAMGISAWAGAAASMGMGVISGWMTVRPCDRRWAGTAMLLLITMDLARANLPVVQTTSSEVWTFTPGLVSALSGDAKVNGPGHFRILSMKDGTAAVSERVGTHLTSRERLAALRRHGLYLEHNAVFQIESIQNYMAGLSPRVEEIGRNASVQLAARYNVAYFIGRPTRFQTDVFAGSIVATVPDYDLALVRNPVAVTPRAYLSRRPVPMTSEMPMQTLLQQDEFLNGEVDGIESALLALPVSSTGGYAAIKEYRPETVRVEVETPQTAVLVLADAFEPGWTAHIDGGNPLPILRANGLVRAVIVPPGRSHVVFEYATPLLLAGAMLSGVGLLLVALLFTLSTKQPAVSNRVPLYQN